MKRIIILLFLSFLLICCKSDTQIEITPTEIPTQTQTPSPTPTETLTPIPIEAIIYPNIEQAYEEGFHILAGHDPFQVDFAADANGGNGKLFFSWDFDGDDIFDSTVQDPEPFLYETVGEYTVTLLINDENGQQISASQRIVVIGEPNYPDWKYGITAHLDWQDFYSRAEADKAAQMINEIGIDIVRHDLGWAGVQPNKYKFDWSVYDNLVELSQKYDFDLLPIIGYSSEWASSVKNSESWEEWFFAPPNQNDFGWYAYNAANRYRGKIFAWQIWNEPNNGFFFKPEPDPIAYGKLLRSAYYAIKYADPDAVVVMAGLSNDETQYIPNIVWYPPVEFLKVLYENGYGKYIDVVARHPYTHPNQGTNILSRKIDEIREVMLNFETMEKPIWITEYGYSALPASGITDKTQARWLTLSFDKIFEFDYVPLVFWYNFREKGEDINNWEHNYGTIQYDWTLKPSYFEYQNYINENQ